jgi:REP element-mobilizing transposase RayT
MKHQRRSIRLRGFDYAQSGAYFVTICAKERECLFGEVVGNKMVLSRFGEITKYEWQQTSEIRPNVVIGDFIIMPNHLHGPHHDHTS